MSISPDLPDAGQPLDAHELAASLTVRDLDQSVSWYQDALGFTLERRHERNGRLVAVSLKAGAVRVLLTQDDGAQGADRTKGVGFSLQLSTTQDADLLAVRARAHAGTLDTEPTDTPWGPHLPRARSGWVPMDHLVRAARGPGAVAQAGRPLYNR